MISSTGIHIRIFIILLLIGGSYFLLPKISFDNSISRWLPQHSKNFQEYKSFLTDFSSDALLILTLEESGEIPQEDLNKHLENIKKFEGVTGISKWPLSIVEHKNERLPNLESYIIRFEPKSFLNPNRPELILSVHKTFSKTNWKYHLAGTGVIHEAINQQTRSNTRRYMLTGFLILLGLLIIILRSWKAIIQTLLVGLGSVSFIIYSAVLFNVPIGIAHTIIPVIIFFYSTSLSIHILAHKGNFREVLIPSLWVILTTSFGFLAFAFSATSLLRDFAFLGLSGLFGVLASAFCLFYPKVNNYSPKKLFKATRRLGHVPFRLIVVSLVVVILISLPGLFQLKAEIYSLSVLSKDNKAYLDHQFIESNVGPYFPLEYVVETTELGSRDIAKWTDSVYSLPEIGAVLSYRQIPPFLSKKKLGYQSKSNPHSFRISFLVPLMSTIDGLDLIQRINKISSNTFNNGKPEITGFMTLYARVATDLFNSFKKSLFWAVVLISAVFLIFLRNWKVSIIAIVVNLLPIIVILGFMGWMNIRLDMVTIPIGCLLLSIVVDDTIHYMYWFRKNNDWKMALEKAGPGILVTSIVLSGGFSVFLFSEAPPVRYFGLLSILAIITALILDLLVLPSLLQKFVNHEN